MQLAAGDTPLLSAFTQGNVIFLQAQSTKQHLRILDGGCDGNGGKGQYAQFVVHVRRPGVVALQSVADGNRWLAICEGKTTGTGHGGPYCEFLVGELEGRYVVLESCQSPGQRVGVQANGKMLLPYNTGTGQCGRFIPVVHQYAPVQHQAYPQGYPPATQPPYAPAQPYAQAYPPEPQPYADQYQAAYPPPYPNEHYPPPPAQPYPGAPQPYAPTGPPVSEHYPPAPQPYPPAPQPYPPAPQPAPPQPMYPNSPASPMNVGSPHDPAPGVPLCVGTTPVLSCFTEGNIVLLKSQATGKSLRITAHGVVEGTGGDGKLAQFTVHVRRQGVAALQNVNNPAHWLSIEGGLTKTSNGDQFCDFYVKDLDGLNVVFESVMFPGNHVGILPDGTVKLPNQTKTGQHARFTPLVFYRNPQPPSMTAPPLNSYPIEPPSQPAPSQPPPAAPSQQYPQPTHQPPPQASKSSKKSSLLDVFGHGCHVFLRARSTGRNLRIRNNIIDGNGGEGQFAKFIVHVRRPNVVALQSVADTRRWVSITGKGHLDGKGGELHPWTELVVKQISNDYVVLESAKFLGWHVGILPTGEPKAACHTGTGQHGQFFPYLVR